MSPALTKLAERLTQEDKLQHIGLALFLVCALQVVVSPIAASVLVFAAGVVKEVWDQVLGTGFCWYDILANVIGIVLAIGLLGAVL